VSFAARRRSIRIAAAVLAIPLLLVLAGFVFLKLTFLKEPPTLADLRRDFPSRRASLETILRMSDEDAAFSRIAPDFLDRGESSAFRRYVKGDPQAGLPATRWDAYRKIFARNGIQLGIQRYASRDAFIMVDSTGLLNRGHISGYAHCSPTAPPNDERIYPCQSHQNSGERKYDPKTREAFQKLDGNWYAYDEGPG
jgi:hypothetical protein